MKKFLMLSVALAAMSMPVMAQTAITGTVTDTKGVAMPGAKVQVKGTNESVLTNMDGTFSVVTSQAKPKLRAEYAGWNPTTKKGKDGMVIKMGKAGWLRFKPERYQLFVGANVVFPDSKVKYAAPGLMLGVVKNFGLYVKGQFNGTVDDADANGSDGWFTGKEKRKYWSASAGVMARVLGPVYLYAGAGFEERSIYWEFLDGKYWGAEGSYDGAMVEAGGMLRFGGFFVNGGVQLNAKHDMGKPKGHFGVGIYF